MEIINKILEYLENIQIKKAVKQIKKNDGRVNIKMYSKWSEQEIINSVLSHSYTDEKEIEFVNGTKIKFITV